MIGRGSNHVIGFERLPCGEDAARFDGHEHGANASFFITRNGPGTRPGLHRHSYEETFIAQEGEARFAVGGQKIVVAPAGMAQELVDAGPGALRQVDIRPASRMRTDRLE
jgi:mannose-6-phosphate isomerase-like protein (cupin superfamily)